MCCIGFKLNHSRRRERVKRSLNPLISNQSHRARCAHGTKALSEPETTQTSQTWANSTPLTTPTSPPPLKNPKRQSSHPSALIPDRPTQAPSIAVWMHSIRCFTPLTPAQAFHSASSSSSPHLILLPVSLHLCCARRLCFAGETVLQILMHAPGH